MFDILHLDFGSNTMGPDEEVPPEIGDQVCVVGLFTSHYGNERNIPIALFGHIAALPEEPVTTEFGYMLGYLIELKSIGGMSGSPVIYATRNFKHAPGSPESDGFFLGLMHGHLVIENPEVSISVSGKKN